MPAIPLDAVAETLPAPPPPEMSRVAEWLNALPLHYREAIAGRYLAGMSYAEIARIQGTSDDVVRVRLHRAKERLRGIILQSENEAQMRSAVTKVLGAVCVVSSTSLFVQRVVKEVNTMGTQAMQMPHPSVSAHSLGWHAASIWGWKMIVGVLVTVLTVGVTGWFFAKKPFSRNR